MSAADSEAAVDRVAKTYAKHGDDFGPYAFLALGLLGWHAPEVLHFILDTADERVGEERP